MLAENPAKLDQSYLKGFPEFLNFLKAKREVSETSTLQQEDQTPQEALEANYQQLRAQLADELLEQVKTSSPEFFERMVVELIVNMGYGGSLKDAGQATRRTNDGGIDGIIKEDCLGLDAIYIQAKRWGNSIQRPEIQKFAGALQGVRCRKGIFITASSFSTGALEYAEAIDSKIVLIDGERLANYMIDFGIGVSVQHRYEVKKLDYDYFIED